MLSRFPIIARHPHTNDDFLLDGRRFRVSRGFAEVEIQVATNDTFTLIAVHLKSRRPIPEADEGEMRLQEAKVLRGIIDEHFQADPEIKLIVLGDFNDVQNALSTRAIIGRGIFKLFDTRPAERNGDTAPALEPRATPRRITWTDYYSIECCLDIHYNFDHEDNDECPCLWTVKQMLGSMSIIGRNIAQDYPHKLLGKGLTEMQVELTKAWDEICNKSLESLSSWNK